MADGGGRADGRTGADGGGREVDGRTSGQRRIGGRAEWRISGRGRMDFPKGKTP